MTPQRHTDRRGCTAGHRAIRRCAIRGQFFPVPPKGPCADSTHDAPPDPQQEFATTWPLTDDVQHEFILVGRGRVPPSPASSTSSYDVAERLADEECLREPVAHFRITTRFQTAVSNAEQGDEKEKFGRRGGMPAGDTLKNSSLRNMCKPSRSQERWCRRRAPAMRYDCFICPSARPTKPVRVDHIYSTPPPPPEAPIATVARRGPGRWGE